MNPGTAITGNPGIATIDSLRCRCVWNGERCPHPATQEDGFCDWCGVRTDEQLMSNPNTILGPDGDFLGLGGAGYAHVDPDRSPDACWMEPDR